MKFKTIALTSIALFTLILGIVKVNSRSQQEELKRLENAPDKGTIAWQARIAKAKGERRVVIPGLVGEYATGIKSLDEVLSRQGVVVAHPIDKKTLIASSNELYRDNEIRTWYKFKILQNYSQGPLPRCNVCSEHDVDRIPQEMLPLNPDEILIETIGGTVEIDGVEVTVVDTEIPVFSESQQYLLFLLADRSGQIGMLRMGAVGIYKVDASGNIEATSKRRHPIIHEIRSIHGNSLKSIQDRIQRRSNEQ